MVDGSNTSPKTGRPGGDPVSGTVGGPSDMTLAQAQGLLQRGFKAMQQGNLKEAGGCCALVLKRYPNLKEAHFLVGLVAIEGTDWPTAKRAFQNVVTIDERHAAAWAQLARSCVMMGQFGLAEKALVNATADETNDPMVMDVIGTAYSLLGNQVEALVWYERACQASPSPFFELGRSKALTFLGRLDEARLSLQRIIDAHPNMPMAHWMIGRLSKAKNHDHLNQMREIEKKIPMGHPDMPFLHYAIGKELEDLEQWDDAFLAYEKGAKTRRAIIQYDEAREALLFETLAKTLTSDWFDRHHKGFADHTPVFIVGQPRTGTTLIERIMTAHSDIESAGELQQFAMAIKRVAGVSSPEPMTPEAIEKIAEADLTALGELYMKTTAPVRGGARLSIDKMPVNYLYLPLIAAALPHAKIIHVVRDPIDSCVSSYKQLFADAYFHSYDQQEMARHHVRYRELMDHWRGILGDRILDVDYEAVVEDLEPNARRIIDFLGLAWQDACVEFHNQSSAVTTASAAQVREKAHTRSVGRWKQYEHHLGPMLEVLRNSGLIDGSG